eukprot:2680017-Rhodomonas_salina.2
MPAVGGAIPPLPQFEKPRSKSIPVRGRAQMEQKEPHGTTTLGNTISDGLTIKTNGLLPTYTPKTSCRLTV